MHEDLAVALLAVLFPAQPTTALGPALVMSRKAAKGDAPSEGLSTMVSRTERERRGNPHQLTGHSFSIFLSVPCRVAGFLCNLPVLPTR
jgi:hypothetical protein